MDIEWAPVGVDVNTPNVARMYDYFLGGKDHFPADRAAAEKILEVVPDVSATVRSNRAFLIRAVRYLAEAGIRQFIDIGTGLPTQNNVHEVAQRVIPDARVVYVDNDPVVLAHARALLTNVDRVTVINGDLRQPERILEQAVRRGSIDLDEPVAILLVAILHFVSDDDGAAGIVARLRDAMAPGSHLVITHATADHDRDDELPKVTSIYAGSNAPVVLRDHPEVLALFGDLDLVPPGLVYTPDWRPDEPLSAKPAHVFCGVGRKN